MSTHQTLLQGRLEGVFGVSSGTVEQAKRDSTKITGETRRGEKKMRDYRHSLRGRCLKGKGKGVLGARETRRACEEGGKRTPARRPLVLLVLNIHQANDKGTQSAMGPRWPGHYFCQFEKRLPKPEIKFTRRILLEIHFNLALCFIRSSIFYWKPIFELTFTHTITFFLSYSEPFIKRTPSGPSQVSALQRVSV